MVVTWIGVGFEPGVLSCAKQLFKAVFQTVPTPHYLISLPRDESKFFSSVACSCSSVALRVSPVWWIPPTCRPMCLRDNDAGILVCLLYHFFLDFLLWLVKLLEKFPYGDLLYIRYMPYTLIIPVHLPCRQQAQSSRLPLRDGPVTVHQLSRASTKVPLALTPFLKLDRPSMLRPADTQTVAGGDEVRSGLDIFCTSPVSAA